MTATSGTTQLTHTLSRTLTELDAGHDRVLQARSQSGEWLNRADAIDGLLGDRAVDYKAERSRLEDLDLVKGISEFQSQQTGLQAAGLPVVPPRDMTPAQFLEHMAVDKKVLDGQLRLVLLKRLGEAVVTADYPREILDATLRSDYAALAQSSNS